MLDNILNVALKAKEVLHYEVKGHVALDRASWFIKSVTVYYEFHMVRKMI